MRRNVHQASRAMQSKDYQQAVTSMKDVIEACPWNSEFREIRAVAYEGLGDLRNAISDLRPTTTLRLDNTAGHLKISSLYYRLGDVEQSLAYVIVLMLPEYKINQICSFREIRECLKLDPDHKECYMHYKHVKKLFKTMESGKNLMKEDRYLINSYSITVGVSLIISMIMVFSE